MFFKSIIGITLLLLLCSVVGAVPTESSMASAPVDQGNAVSDTNTIMSYWQTAGYTRASLITSVATKTAVLDYWKNDSNLLRYNNIGHTDTASTNGAPAYGLYFYNNQEITATEITNLNPYNGLGYSHIFINSCNSFENPLHDAFLSKGVYNYIGGVVLLPMYDSEDTAADFWNNYSNLGQSFPTALANAEDDHGTTGMYGCYGS
jgi:hypothetical protein